MPSVSRVLLDPRQAPTSSPSYSTFIRPQGSRPIDCRDESVTSRSTWMRRNFRRSCSCRPPPPSLRTTCQTSGTSARDSASSRSSRSSRCSARSPTETGALPSCRRPSARAAGSAGRGPSSSRPGRPRPAGCRRRPAAAGARSGGPCPAPARARRRRWWRAPGAPARGSGCRCGGRSRRTRGSS